MIARLIIRRVCNETPAIVPPPPTWQESLATAMHILLYAFLIVMPLLMSGMMSGIICMVNLVRALGWSRAALAAWPGTWLLAWAVAFPTVLLVIPVVKRITGRLVRLS